MNPDLLDRLADVPLPAPTVRLDAVERRAHHLRAARRARRIGVGTAALASVLVLGGVVVPQLDDHDAPQGSVTQALGLGVSPARASDEGATCGAGRASWVDRTSWAQDPAVTDAAALVADAPWPLTGLGVHQADENCLPSVPAAVLVDTDPVRGLVLWADVADPFGSGLDGVVDVTVRGTDARLRDLDGAVYVSWVDDAGVRWMANGSGVTAAELVADVDALDLDGTRVLPSSVPAGFDVVPVTGEPTSPSTRTWWAFYGDTTTQEQDANGTFSPVPGAGVELEATTQYHPPVQVDASYYAAQVRFADVNGAVASFSPMGDPAVDVGGWLTWQRDGVTYTLVGAVPMDTLVGLARSVQPVAVDDPRVAAAPEPFTS